MTQPTTALAKTEHPARKYARASRAPATRRAYASAWRDFSEFCAGRQEAPLPASARQVIEYITFLADHGAKVATIQSRHAAITAAHRAAGYVSPTADEGVRQIMAGIRRTKGAPPEKKTPLSPEDLAGMLAQLSDDAAGLRARALILLGFAGAFRRSELVALDVEDLKFQRGELKVTVRHSKNDQDGHGLIKSIPTLTDSPLDPVRAVRAWLAAAGRKAGPLFTRLDSTGQPSADRLSPQTVATVVKAAAAAAGLDPATVSGHSLRSGYITSAFGNGAAEWEVQQQSGHHSAQVLRGYIQDAGRGAKRATLAAFGESK